MIFLSHASPDKPEVRFIGEELEACGLSTWLDEHKLPVGVRLTSTIETAIESAGAMLVFLSTASLKSDWVKREMEIARDRRASHSTFIPCLLGNIELSDLPPDLADTLCADLRSPARHATEMGRILNALGTERELAWPPLDAHRSSELRRRAAHPDLRRRVVDWLVATASELPDATERYWAYLTVGYLGDESTTLFLDRAVAQEDGFARRGALRGRELLNQSPQSGLLQTRSIS